MYYINFVFNCFILSLILAKCWVDANVEKVRLNNEKLLIKRFFEKYPGKYGRPLLNHTEGPVIFKLRVQIIQIVKVDPVDQVLVTNVWNNFHWKDPYLEWEPSRYNGLSVIRIPAKFAFEHDIVLLNTADERLSYNREALLVVYPNGEILWIPRSLFSSTCRIDLKFFPFDYQNCSLSFGSWAYDSSLVDLDFYENITQIDLSDYEPSKEWEIDRDALHGVKEYREQGNKKYTVLTYYLVVRRNPRFYTNLLIYPCVLLAILTMVVFWLPPETPSKTILGMNIFTAFFLLLLLLAEIVPTNTNVVPYIGIFFCMSMVMIALSLFLCTIVVHLFFRADKFCKMPYIMRKVILDGLARLYCMQPERPAQSVSQRTLINSGLLHGGKNVQNADKFEKFELLKERFKTYRENVLKVGFENLLKTHPNLSGSCTNVHMSNFNIYSSASSSPSSTLNLNHANKQSSGGGVNQCMCSYCTYCSRQQTILAEIAYLNNLENDIKEIRDYLRDTRKKLETKEVKIKLASDWKQVALVLDRTFFIIYFLITVSTLVWIFTSDAIIRATLALDDKKTHTDAQTTTASPTDAAGTGTVVEQVAASLLSTITNVVTNVTTATLSFSNRNNEQNSSGFLFF